MSTISEKLQAIRELLGIKMQEDTPDPAQAAAETPTENTAKAKDGTEVKWTGELAAGSEVKIVTPEGEVTPPDGNIELEDGKILTVSAGKITAITQAAAPEQGVGFEKQIEDLTTKFTSQIEALKTELAVAKKAHTEQLTTLTAVFSKTVELVEQMNETEKEPEAPVNTAFAAREDKEKEKDRKLRELSESIDKLAKEKN